MQKKKKARKFSTIPMVFRMPEQMLVDITAIADDNMISASAVCRQALAEYVKNIKEENNG